MADTYPGIISSGHLGWILYVNLEGRCRVYRQVKHSVVGRGETCLLYNMLDEAGCRCFEVELPPGKLASRVQLEQKLGPLPAHPYIIFPSSPQQKLPATTHAQGSLIYNDSYDILLG